MSKVAEFVAGLRLEGDIHTPEYVPRNMTLIRSKAAKAYDLNVRFPEEGSEPRFGETFWKPLVREFRDIIQKNRSTLFFVRSRRLSESITLKINAGLERSVAYAHHGSLAKELRLEVENRLKSGELKAIVATNSLELGIDIGTLDEVVLIQSPPSISSAVQRVGRAGHRVGEISHGTFYPTSDQDYVASAVIAKAVLEGDIEEVRPVEGALDILAQIIISMTGIRTWDIDALYAQLRTSWPYRRLSREQFDLVLNMLAGRYAETRVRELKPRVSIDRLDNTVAARKGALLHLYISGGTIPDRGYYHLRHEETSALIGELDEEFVWEASVGQTFTFGTQHWKIRRITHNDVLVTQAPPKTLETPFWKGEVSNRDFHLAKKISEFLEEADARLDDAEWLEELQAEYRLTPMAAAHLKDYLAKQKKVTESPLPHRRNILIEHIQTGPGGVPGNQVVIHTFWGGRVNRPFALALDAAWEEQFGHRLEIFPGDESIVLQLPDPASAADLFSLITPENLEDHLRRRLESSGFFGARFRENAGRALLLTKRRLNERMPLWMSRLRSQKLLQSVMSLTDFPVLLETWRTCLQDEFDLDALRQVLREVASGTIRVSECTTSHPSPMAQGLTWAQINQYMYAADGLPADRTSRLRTDLLREVVFSPGLRPVIPEKIIQEFESKRQRIHPGYAPGSGRELVDWIKERVLIPWEEWQALERAIHRDRADADQPPEENPLEEAGAKLVRLEIKDTGTFVVATLERLPGIQESLFGSCPSNWMLLKPSEARPALTGAEEVSASEQDILFTSLLGEWLQFYGPLAPADIGARLGLEPSRLQLALEDLKDAEALITGRLIQDAEADTVCDAENFEILLRMARAAAAPQVQAREISELQAFLAGMQELVSPREGADGLFQALERLVGYPVPARLWESEVLPARIPGYTADWLDSLLRQGALRWQGDKERRVRFFFEEDAALLSAAPNENTDENGSGTEEQKADSVASLFSDPSARYDFSVLLSRSGQQIRILEDRLWEGVWQGRISNDTFSALRRGLENSFRVSEAVERQQKALRAHGHRGRRLHLSRWKESQPYPGSWFLLPEPSQEDREDLIELEERRKDRVRILLDRYGILFREILHREQLLFRWPDVFRTLRLMELSGEVLAGLFFKGISGPQFMSHRAFRFFQQELSKEAVYWMNALDPASLCGVPLEGIRGSLPKRIEGNHVVFRGKDPVLISQRKGGQLTFRMPPDDPRLSEYLVILQHLLNREFSPQRRLIVESINEEPAPQSPYLPALQAGFDTVVDIKHVSLYRRAKS
jgi:ATP-dependent Lhr-like helicase